MGCELTKVLRRIASSDSSSFDTVIPATRFPLLSLNEYSLKLVERAPKPTAFSLFSYSWSYEMKLALISRSGLREFKNSSVLISDHRYLRIK